MERPGLLPGFDWLAEHLVEKGWSRSDAHRSTHELRLFLTACAGTEEPLVPPTLSCDEAWHAFILHTREYQAYCAAHVGHFLHHAPAAAGEHLDPERAVEAMSRLDPGWRRTGASPARCDKPGEEPAPVCKTLLVEGASRAYSAEGCSPTG